MTQITPRARTVALAAVGAATALVLVAATSHPAEAKRQKRKVARNLSVVAITPLGLQGTAGAGDRTVLPFVLLDRASRRVDVEVEYGIDRDGDGVVADGTEDGLPSEYRPATHLRRDLRDTGRVKQRADGSATVTYRPSRAGATHAFVWDNLSDLGRDRVLAGAQLQRDETGRVLRDPFDPAQPLFTDELAGVVLRVRAVRRGGKRERTEWAYTEPFSVDSSRAPSATVDEVLSMDAGAGLAEIAWTAYDDDSEDLNGNGELDLLDLEDADGDGQLDVAPVAVAFDYHRLADGAPVPRSVLELETLDWYPCTRADGLGDPDTGLPTAPEGVGRAATFVWDLGTDLGSPEFAAGRYLVRAVPYDATGKNGDPAYHLEPLVIEPAGK